MFTLTPYTKNSEIHHFSLTKHGVRKVLSGLKDSMCEAHTLRSDGTGREEVSLLMGDEVRRAEDTGRMAGLW